MPEDEEGKAQKIGFSAKPADVEAMNHGHMKAEQLADRRMTFSEFMRTAVKWALNDEGFWQTYQKEVEGKQ